MGLHHAHTSSEWRRNWPLSAKASHSPKPRREKKAPGEEASREVAGTKKESGKCSLGNSQCVPVWDLTGPSDLGCTARTAGARELNQT